MRTLIENEITEVSGGVGYDYKNHKVHLPVFKTKGTCRGCSSNSNLGNDA